MCAAIERARFAVWEDEEAVLVPLSYVRAVQRAGGAAILLPPDEGFAESPDELLDRLDGLLIAGGSDIDAASYGAQTHSETVNANPERDRFEIALARRALERELPFLGVCRGLQVLNVARGGTIDQHIPDRLGHERHRPVSGEWAEHEVKLEPGSLAARSAGADQLTVKTHHHQGVGDLGEGLVASAWATDDEEIEALELPDRDLALGVLWHPEEDPEDRVIRALVEEAGAGAG